MFNFLGGQERENGQHFSTGSKTLLGQDRRWLAIAQLASNRYRLGHASVPKMSPFGGSMFSRATITPSYYI